MQGDDVVEVGHETCDDAHEDVCARDTYSIGLDGDRVVVIGNPIREVAP